MSSPTLAVGAVLLRADGAVLLVRRARPPAVGSWTLPGGRVEEGEAPEQAIVREIAEETSLRVAPIAIVETLTLEREGYSYRIVDFLCRVEAPDVEPRAGDDVDAARWVLPSEFGSLALTPEVVRVIARAREISREA